MKELFDNLDFQGQQNSLSFVEVYFSSAIHGVPITASSPFSEVLAFVPTQALSRQQ